MLDLFKGAIERERETQEAYREMLRFNDDPDIKRIIEGFVRQEQHYEETLLTLQSTLRSPTIESFEEPSLPGRFRCIGRHQRRSAAWAHGMICLRGDTRQPLV